MTTRQETTAPSTLHRGNTKIIVCPVIHESHGRVTRRTWTAAVVLRVDSTPGGDPAARVLCGHEQHPTTSHAAECARKAWTRLPQAGA